MPGTVSGGKRAATTNKRLYGQDFYKRIGKTGGEKSQGGGFAVNRELARLAGRVGGITSRKDKSELTGEELYELEKAKAELEKLRRTQL